MTLKELRIKRLKTQAEVAKALKTTQAHLSRLEGGYHKPSDIMVRRLAKYYRVSEDVILQATSSK